MERWSWKSSRYLEFVYLGWYAFRSTDMASVRVVNVAATFSIFVGNGVGLDARWCYSSFVRLFGMIMGFRFQKDVDVKCSSLDIPYGSQRLLFRYSQYIVVINAPRYDVNQKLPLGWFVMLRFTSCKNLNKWLGTYRGISSHMTYPCRRSIWTCVAVSMGVTVSANAGHLENCARAYFGSLTLCYTISINFLAYFSDKILSYYSKPWQFVRDETVV
jgi:hypothetical protein